MYQGYIVKKTEITYKEVFASSKRKAIELATDKKLYDSKFIEFGDVNNAWVICKKENKYSAEPTLKLADNKKI